MASQFLNLFSRGTIDRMLEASGPLREWPYEGDPDGRFTAVVDIFGDASVWAIHVPGHSPGSTAYLVRTTTGPKLLVGDASHTRRGLWEWSASISKMASNPARFRSTFPAASRASRFYANSRVNFRRSTSISDTSSATRHDETLRCANVLDLVALQRLND